LTAFRSEDALFGIAALALMPWIARVMLRGLRSARLPIGRSQVIRGERPGAFGALLVFYAAMLVLNAAVAADLLFNLDIRNAL